MLFGYKKSILRATLGVVALLLFATIASAQESRKLLQQPAPSYPQLARRLALTGTVKVDVVIAPDGHIKDTKVIGGHPLLVTSALDALKQWKYEAANSETTATLEFHFHP